MNPVVPQWKLERYLLGELPQKDLDQIRKMLETDPLLRSRLENLQTDTQQFRERHLSLGLESWDVAASKPAPFQKHKIWRGRGWALAAAALVALTAPIGFFSMQSDKPAKNSMQIVALSLEDETRTKGLHDRLELWLKDGDGVALLKEGVKLRQGELIQIFFQVEKKGYAAILSLDGRGHWTTHFPEMGGSAQMVESGKPGFLPFSYQLDDAPRYEVFWLLTCDQPFSVDSLTGILATQSDSVPPERLPLDEHFHQIRLLVRK
ncbi:MAG TPA: hypothetical protein VLM37_01260 [Fibrobacteraceae bacterium]|nr:hypothetical protein [Fibrobacteraceae bacterium]